ncbi:unnamed protein product, partial [marine sediment metagenome]
AEFALHKKPPRRVAMMQIGMGIDTRMLGLVVLASPDIRLVRSVDANLHIFICVLKIGSRQQHKVVVAPRISILKLGIQYENMCGTLGKVY